MVTPSIFPSSPTIRANYDWIDLASATGYIIFDGINAANDSGDDYVLIDSTHSATIAPGGDSKLIYTQNVNGNGTGGNPGKGTDIDFDLSQFQLPRTIEGDAFVRICLSGDGTAGNSPSNVYLVLRLRKWDGSTETEIANVQTHTVASISNSDESEFLGKITVPKTHFKQGEQIRLTVEVWSESSAVYYMDLGHNPNDAAVGQFSAGNSRLTLAVPFKLDFM